MAKISAMLLFLAVFLMPSQAKALDFMGNGGGGNPLLSLLDGVTVEGRVSAFLPESKRVRRIYDDAIPFYQYEVAKTFCNGFQGWFDVGYFEDRGRSIPLHNKTRIRLLPLGFGVKYIFPVFSCLNAYVGGGGLYSFLRIKDHSPFVKRHIRKNEWGGIVKIGFTYSVTCHLYIDIFADYLFQRFDFHRHPRHRFVERNDLNLNGVSVGAGIGFKF